LDLFSATRPNEFAENLIFCLSFEFNCLSFHAFAWVLRVFFASFLSFFLSFELVLTNTVQIMDFCVH